MILTDNEWVLFHMNKSVNKIRFEFNINRYQTELVLIR